MKNLILSILLLLSLHTAGQSIDVIEPEVGRLLEFNYSLEPLLEQRNNLYTKDELTLSEEAILDSINTLLGDYYDISIYETIGPGCSWYCGGGPHSIKASSFLSSTTSTNYSPENAHDFSYKTVWAEGVEGYGIGEYIEYHFLPNNPRITEIIIANGHVKTDNAWFDNSRVKTLKMYVNGLPYASLELHDTKALQSFRLKEPLGRNNGENNWILKFEITDIYKGDKYDDVVISELFFDGTDVH